MSGFLSRLMALLVALVFTPAMIAILWVIFLALLSGVLEPLALWRLASITAFEATLYALLAVLPTALFMFRVRSRHAWTLFAIVHASIAAVGWMVFGVYPWLRAPVSVLLADAAFLVIAVGVPIGIASTAFSAHRYSLR